jgi:hypothetical protein
MGLHVSGSKVALEVVAVAERLAAHWTHVLQRVQMDVDDVASTVGAVAVHRLARRALKLAIGANPHFGRLQNNNAGFIHNICTAFP